MMALAQLEAMQEQQVVISAKTLSHLQKEAKALDKDPNRIRKILLVDIRTLDLGVVKAIHRMHRDKELMVATLLHNLNSVKMLYLVEDQSCIRIKGSLSSSKCTKTPRIKSIHSTLLHSTKT